MLLKVNFGLEVVPELSRLVAGELPEELKVCVAVLSPIIDDVGIVV